MPSPTTPEGKPSRLRRALRALAILAGIGLASALALWIAIHRYPELATFLVDNVRKVIGPAPIAWAEDFAYGIQDKYNQWRYSDKKPTAYWDTPGASASAPALPPPDASASPAASGSAPAALAGFPPPPFTPPHAGVALGGDGQWVAMPTPQDPASPPILYKALVHPDPKRNFALVAVVAIDLRRADIHAVPGFGEPQSHALTREQRPGLVPAEHFPELLATFNGGFQAVHGQWGMMINGTTLLAPRPIGCTVSRYKDGSMRVAVWKRIADTEPDMVYYRQTPPCLVEGGEINPATRAESNTGWGATVDGETIIRRSAFGLDKTGTIAFYGMGDALSAGTLAQAMHAAGAHDAAQLDVNWSYPRFFSYDGKPDPRIAQPLAPVQNWKNDEYVARPAYRDFFYIARKKPAPAP